MRDKLINITNNMVIPQDITENILNAEARRKEAYEKFVNDRIKGHRNLWDKMKKVKVQTWTSAGKEIRSKHGKQEIVMKESASMLARLLVTSPSSRDVDLKEVVCMYEPSTTNSCKLEVYCIHAQTSHN